VKRRKRRLANLETQNTKLSATVERQRRQLQSKLAEIDKLCAEMESLKSNIYEKKRTLTVEKFEMERIMTDRTEEAKQRMVEKEEKIEQYLRERVLNMDKAMEKKERELQEYKAAVSKRIEEKSKEFLQRKEAISKIIEEKSKGMPWLAEAFADYFELQDLRKASHLAHKSHPARKAAEQVREVAKKRREAEKKWRRAKYLLRYWQNMLPHMFDFEGETIDEMIATTLNLPEEEEIEKGIDPAIYWQGNAVKEELSHQERLQRALDNWRRRPLKSRWQVGRDYERYAAWWYWEKGYRVIPSGVLYREEDLGRDVIAMKGNEVHIVQCKYWAKWRTIYENHIAQLFGTTMMYRVEEEQKQRPQNLNLFQEKLKVKPVFMTSTELSPVARRFAEILKVEVKENFKLKDYPLIKCNISRHTGEKIYHLPFDQQYDRVKVERKRGETYVCTIKEAEVLGFRRTYRWHGEHQESK